MERTTTGWGAVFGALVAASLLVAPDVRPARAEEPAIVRAPEFTQRVEAAIAKGVAWFRIQQQTDGTFESLQDLAHTARIYHALRVCRVDRSDPTLEKCYAALQARYAEEKKDNKSMGMHLGTMEAGLLCLAIASHGTAQAATDASGEPSYVLDAKDKAWMQELAKFLEGAQRANGTWPMYVDLADEPGDIDVTFTYSALLGLKAASRSGVKVQSGTWTKSLQYIRGQQDSKGEAVPAPPGGAKAAGAKAVRARGWDLSCKKGSADFDPSDWDTANALASMAICRSELLNALKGKAPLGDAATEVSFRDGLAYLGHEKFILEMLEDRREDVAVSYYEDAFTLERAGDLLGVERMGTLDWYGVGAEALLRRQAASGAWEIKTDSEYASLRRGFALEASAYALLFLARGTSRVRWTGTLGADDSDIRFDAAAALAPADFGNFIDLVLSRWRRATDPAVKDRLLAKTTAVGPKVVAPVVERLASDDAEVRGAAIALLRRATGLDHEFDAAGAADVRAAAVGRWKEWLAENEATLHYDAASERIVP